MYFISFLQFALLLCLLLLSIFYAFMILDHHRSEKIKFLLKNMQLTSAYWLNLCENQ